VFDPPVERGETLQMILWYLNCGQVDPHTYLPPNACIIRLLRPLCAAHADSIYCNSYKNVKNIKN
jgi:hypothetical protein